LPCVPPQLLRTPVTAKGAGLRLKRALVLDPFRTVVPAAAYPQPSAAEVASMSLLDAHCGTFQKVMVWDYLREQLPGYIQLPGLNAAAAASSANTAPPAPGAGGAAPIPAAAGGGGGQQGMLPHQASNSFTHAVFASGAGVTAAAAGAAGAGVLRGSGGGSFGRRSLSAGNIASNMLTGAF
jgi:hypothetical protein